MSRIIGPIKFDMKFMNNLPLHRLDIFVILFLACVPGASGLDCFKCVSAWTVRECMQDDPETCGWGQICSSTVKKGELPGVKYTKGCLDDSRCYSLQNLNQGTACNQDPSICVYCCETELCNTAVTSHSTRTILLVLMLVIVLMASF